MRGFGNLNKRIDEIDDVVRTLHQRCSVLELHAVKYRKALERLYIKSGARLSISEWEDIDREIRDERELRDEI